MSVVRPFRVFGQRGYIGDSYTLDDARLLAPRVGRAVIVDMRTGSRFVRRPGGWAPDGVDRLIARRLRQSQSPHPERAA